MPGVTFIPQPTASLIALLRLLEYTSPVPRMSLGGYTLDDDGARQNEDHGQAHQLIVLTQAVSLYWLKRSALSLHVAWVLARGPARSNYLLASSKKCEAHVISSLQKTLLLRFVFPANMKEFEGRRIEAHFVNTGSAASKQ
ncbi:MAG: hypothetical protein M1824_002546 [Vezdaea acicularis]|nr:MAG: hypothetical protein M1824_002546 [Vezdaea acicularis]